MSTRAYIGRLNADGSVDSIYCHNSGDLAYDVLVNHYATRERVNKLIALGDLSNIGPSLDQNPLIKLYHFNMGIDNSKCGKAFSRLPFDTRMAIYDTVKYFCTAYYRDRAKFLDQKQQQELMGEVVTKPHITHDDNVKQYVENCQKSFIAYCYLYTDGQWITEYGNED